MRKIKEGIILDVEIKPRSNAFRLLIDHDRIIIFCSEEPVKGKVNKELVKELSRLLKKEVSIITGFSRRHKRLLVRNCEEHELRHLLQSSYNRHEAAETKQLKKAEEKKKARLRTRGPYRKASGREI
jgi:uncharacterized protein (TIGR00251 family)